MPNIKEIAQKITSVKSAQQITKAMKMVAAAKLNKVQAKATQLYPYKQKLKQILENVTNKDNDNFFYPLLREKNSNQTLFIVIGSDKGLCGAYNTNVFKKFLQYIDEYKKKFDEKNIVIAPIGEKTLAFFKKRANDILLTEYVDAIAKLSYENARTIATNLITDFTQSKYRKIFIIYTNFKSVSSNKPLVEQFFPINFSDVIKEMSKIKSTGNDYIFDSNKNDTLEIILPKYALIHFYSILLESSASEHSSRMITMNKATDNASNLLSELKLKYDRIRQATITQEIAEIVAGAASS